MELRLNIYDGKKIEKTYTATEVNLMWGTMEDLLGAIDLDKTDDNKEVGKMIIKLLPQINPLLKQIFEGITDSELRRVKVKDIVPICLQILTYSIAEMNTIGGNEKN